MCAYVRKDESASLVLHFRKSYHRCASNRCKHPLHQTLITVHSHKIVRSFFRNCTIDASASSSQCCCSHLLTTKRYKIPHLSTTTSPLRRIPPELASALHQSALTSSSHVGDAKGMGRVTYSAETADCIKEKCAYAIQKYCLHEWRVHHQSPRRVGVVNGGITDRHFSDEDRGKALGLRVRAGWIGVPRDIVRHQAPRCRVGNAGVSYCDSDVVGWKRLREATSLFTTSRLFAAAGARDSDWRGISSVSGKGAGIPASTLWQTRARMTTICRHLGTPTTFSELLPIERGI